MPLVLTTLEDYALFVGGVDASDEPRVTAILEGVEGAILRWMRAGVVQETVVEFYDGTGKCEIVLKRRPVTEVLGVRIDANGGYGRPDRFGVDAEIDVDTYGSQSLEMTENNPGLLWRASPWPVGKGNIRIEYTAGYDPIPAEIAMAVHRLAGSVASSDVARGPLSSETLGRYSWSALTSDQSKVSGIDVASIKGMLEPYSRSWEAW